jgi:hypothetical protein
MPRIGLRRGVMASAISRYVRFEQHHNSSLLHSSTEDWRKDFRGLTVVIIDLVS